MARPRIRTGRVRTTATARTTRVRSTRSSRITRITRIAETARTSWTTRTTRGGGTQRRSLIVLAAAGALAAASGLAPVAHAAQPKAAASLAALFDNAGISDDANPAAADLDGGGFSFSAEALAAVGWSPGAALPLADGAVVQVPNLAPGRQDNVLAAGQSFADQGSGAALDFVATSTDGATGGNGEITYTDGSTQSYSLSVADWWSGTASIAAGSGYRNSPGGAEVHQVSLFTDAVTLAAGKTVATVTLPDVGSNTVATAALHVFATAFAPASGPSGLSAAFDNVGISDNADPTAADIDGTGHSFSAEDLAADGWVPGAELTLDGTPLRWPNVPAGSADNVVADGQRIAVSGSGDALTLVVASTAGATSGTGTISYTDGSTQTYSLSNADWYTGPTDTMAVQLPNWNTASGTQSAAVKLSPDTVPLDPAKTVAAVTLPAVSAAPGASTAALHVFALGIRPSSGAWRGSWAAAADDGLVNGPWTARTLRMVEHTSVGGAQVRIRLDNDFNTAPVVIGHATIAVQSSAANATAAPVTLTFGGNQGITLPSGGQAVSDGVPFTVPADANLLVSLYLPGPVALAPYHSLGEQDMYSTADQAGDQTTDISNYPVNNTFGFWTLLSGLDVGPAAGSSGTGAGTVVALGDSITDGVGSDYNGNDRWPNDLARRLLDQTQYPQMGVVDEGISANRVASDDFDGLAGTGTGGISALSRLQRDVLAQPGTRTVIVFEGINDVKSGTSADAVIAGLEQIAAECHAAGLRVLAGTITPFEGYSAYTAAYEAARQDVNSFIRSNGGRFDGVIDFDATVRDPGNPSALLPAYDSGDHLHPSAAGYQAMANAIDLSTLG